MNSIKYTLNLVLGKNHVPNCPLHSHIGYQIHNTGLCKTNLYFHNLIHERMIPHYCKSKP
jgi:hypothetical protein